MSEAAALRWAAAIAWTTAALFFAVALFIAIVIPIHFQDALTFGEWSRLIAEEWGFHYPSVPAQAYGRPLFYVLQGWTWGLLGFAEPLGRVLSGLFSLLLLAALIWLVRDRPWGRAAAALAAVALVASPVFANQVVSGLTDIPVAALVAVAGALVWGRRPGEARAAAAGLVAALAVLAKPSALLALVGLACAQLLVAEPVRLRLLYRVVPLAAGVVAGLVYDLTQARYVDQGLRTFLQAGVNTDYYRTLADEARRFALLDASWFGDSLRVPVLFALAYAVLRLAQVAHRAAAAVAVVFGLIASWLGPWLAAGENDFTVGSLHSTGAALATLGSAAVLTFAAFYDGDAVPSSRELLRFGVWALPTFLAWVFYGAYDFRLLAPAWPPLLALIVVCALPAVAALARRGPYVAAIPFVLLAIVVAENVYNVDGLGKSGWSEVRRTPVSDWSNESTMRAIVMPAFSRTLDVVQPFMRPEDELISPEGAFRFFFPGHVEQAFPSGCGHLARFRVFVLLTDEGSRRYMEDFLHVSGDPSYWANCEEPRLQQLTDGSEGYAVFVVES